MEKEKCCYDICEKLELIVHSQNEESCEEKTLGCDRPYLGPVKPKKCFNTKPIILYSCCTGGQWSMPFRAGEITGNSTIFRVEKVENCCATCRVLTENPNSDPNRPYISTNTLFTINLDCVLAITTLPITYVDLC